MRVRSSCALDLSGIESRYYSLQAYIVRISVDSVMNHAFPFCPLKQKNYFEKNSQFGQFQLWFKRQQKMDTYFW